MPREERFPPKMMRDVSGDTGRRLDTGVDRHAAVRAACQKQTRVTLKDRIEPRQPAAMTNGVLRNAAPMANHVSELRYVPKPHRLPQVRADQIDEPIVVEIHHA